MIRVKFECPLDFVDRTSFFTSLLERNIVADDVDPHVLVTNPGMNGIVDEMYISRFRSLTAVITPSTGTNHIDVKSLRESGITIKGLLDVRESLNKITASSEFTWLHVMNLMRKFTFSCSRIHLWRDLSNEACMRSIELSGKSIGMIGMGRIGSNIARYANAFMMDSYFYDPYVDTAPNAKKVDSIQQLAHCNVIVISCSLTDETKNLITFDVLGNMGNGSFIVNTSRGEVVDECYIKHLVLHKKIYYGADVLSKEQEPDIPRTSILYNLSLSCDRVVITPHVAGVTIDSQTKALYAAVELIESLQP